MIKQEIASNLGVPLATIQFWADQFADWLDVDSRCIDKAHDEEDLTIFRIIHELDQSVTWENDHVKRTQLIKQKLFASQIAKKILINRKALKSQPEIMRWNLVATSGFSLSRSFEWLKPIDSFVSNIIDFGCWAVSGTVCSEPFALLWVLNADRVVVIEKEPDHIHNAKKRLQHIRSQHSFFADYHVTFEESDMCDGEVATRYCDKFDLAYCHNVLYYMQQNLDDFQKAIHTMQRVVNRGGWFIAVEENVSSGEITRFFRPDEWGKVDLRNMPDCSYCYRKLS